MKKFSIILAIAIAVSLFVGCASSGGSSGGSKSGGGDAPYTVDLTKLVQVVNDPQGYEVLLKSGNYKTSTALKNPVPFGGIYDNLLFLFPELPADITKYKRVTINCKYYNAKNEELAQSDTKAMVTLILDPKGDLRGPDMGPGKNTPLKEFNVGGYSGLVSTDKGTRVTLSQAPGAILFQNSGNDVKFIEVTQITFHNGTASGN